MEGKLLLDLMLEKEVILVESQFILIELIKIHRDPLSQIFMDTLMNEAASQDIQVIDFLPNLFESLLSLVTQADQFSDCRWRPFAQVDLFLFSFLFQ